MELKDFIKTTIKDISNAVTELNEEMGDKGLILNPIPDNHQEGMVYSQDGRWLQKIEFNVSVTTSENSSKEGGVKICVAKAGISEKTTNEAISSLHFHITVALPTCIG